MKAETIISGLNYLGLATNQPLDENRLAIYVGQLVDLKNEELFADTIKLLANESAFMPKIAEIRATYRELLMRHVPKNALMPGQDTGWQHIAGALDDCAGDCGRKRPLSELMRHTGLCIECFNTPDRAQREDERLQRWFQPPSLRDLDAA